MYKLSFFKKIIILTPMLGIKLVIANWILLSSLVNVGSYNQDGTENFIIQRDKFCLQKLQLCCKWQMLWFDQILHRRSNDFFYQFLFFLGFRRWPRWSRRARSSRRTGKESFREKYSVWSLRSVILHFELPQGAQGQDGAPGINGAKVSVQQKRTPRVP